MLRPAGNDAGAEHVVQQLGQVVAGFKGQGDVHVVCGCCSTAVPPADVAELLQPGKELGQLIEGGFVLQAAATAERRYRNTFRGKDHGPAGTSF